MPRRRSGLKVLKAVSSVIRLKVLNLLLTRGPLSYTEIMKILRLSPTRDAGRFAYHLKYLLKADLVEPDTEAKKYRLTDLGHTIIDVTEDIEKRFFMRRKMLVRTSHLAMEEFDRNKIVDSLVREANVPMDLAQKIARETEGRLSEFKTKYLTAPLIREFVNAVLVEKGLEEYRHRLTRLGLPVYDVAQLIKTRSTTFLGVESVQKAASDAVLEEYTLLNVLPRDIADAHLSGRLHLNSLGCWILKPNEFMHDLRFFLQHGVNLGRTNLTGLSSHPPTNLESALSTASNVLKIASTETSGEQAFDYFNVFLAPFTNGLSEERIRESLRTFVVNLNQSSSSEGFPIEASLGLELVIPDFLEKKRAIGPGGKKTDRYGDFVEESHLIASLLSEVVSEDDRHKPIFNPSLIVKLRPEALGNNECSNALQQFHRLAAEKGLPYFANLQSGNQKHTSYTATGCRFAADWKDDWELDTLQTGSIDNVSLNLPRASYDAEGSQSVFFELLDERLEMAQRALEIKYRTLRQRVREGLLPFLNRKVDGNYYFRLENATRLVSLVGLSETVESFLEKPMHYDNETIDFAGKILRHLNKGVQSSAKKPETRLALSMVPSSKAAKRLAELDVEHCGWEKVRVQGTKEEPFYTDMVAVPLTNKLTWRHRLRIEGEFHKLASGSHLALIQLADAKQNPDALLSVTKEIVKGYKVGLYAYNRNLTYCANCQKTFYGVPPKCSLCGSTSMLFCFSRISAKHLAAPFWNSAQISALSNRVTYVLISG